MGVETLGSSITTSIAPSITPAPSFGGEIGSSFSLADTVPLSAPSEFSVGGTFDSSFASFSDLQPYSFSDSSATLQNDSGVMTEIPSVFEVGLADINLDLDVPSYEIPQAFYNAFTEEKLLTPPTYLESFSEPSFEQNNIIDIPELESQSINIEQINYSTKPEIGQAEAEMVEEVNSSWFMVNSSDQELINEQELSDFPLREASRLPSLAEINNSNQELVNVEELTAEVQEITAQTSVIPSEVKDRVWPARHRHAQALAGGESTQLVEDCHVADPPRNDNYEISEPALLEAVNELAILTEAPILPEVISSEQLSVPEIIQISDQVYPEMVQATKTYQAFLAVGVEEAQAAILVQDALILAGAQPEVAEQTMVQVKTSTKTAVEIEGEIVVKPSYAKASTGEERKIELKFVVDEKALAQRNEALKRAVQLAPVKTDLGEDIIDSNDVGALMPTEVQNPGVGSGILPKHFIEWLNRGDGAYRSAVASIKSLGVWSKGQILKAGLELNRKFYPVTIDTVGEEAEKESVALVLEHKPDPIRHLRK